MRVNKKRLLLSTFIDLFKLQNKYFKQNSFLRFIIGNIITSRTQTTFLSFIIGPFSTLILLTILDQVMAPFNVILSSYLAVVWSAYVGGMRSAITSSLITWIYAAYRLSEPGQLFVFSDSNAHSLSTIGLTVISTAIFSGLLKHRSNFATIEHLRRQESELITKQIKESETEYKSLFFNNPNMMVVFDPATFRFLALNDAVIQHYGYSKQELLNMKITDLSPPQEQRSVSGLIRKFTTSKSPGVRNVIGTWQHIKKDGRLVFIEGAVSLINFGHKNAILAMINDVTERKRLEKLKDTLLSIVAHELKTPITTLKLLVESRIKRLFKKPTDSLNLEDLQTIDHELDYLTTLINDMLDLRRIEAGELKMDITEFNLSDLLHQVTVQMQTIAGSRALICKPANPIRVFADSARIKQILINLISNAIKHSPSTSKIIISAKKQNSRILVSVKDHGEGIAKSKLPHIFDRYYRASYNQKDSFGLGLYISKEIVSRHNGKIWVESTLGRGSTFYFTLMSSYNKS